MKKKECPSCAMQIDSESKVCPICEFEFPETGKNRKWILIVLMLLVLISTLLGWFRRFF